MVKVEGGTFLMGDIIDSTNTDALPIHEVSLDDYYIGKYEVTFAQYDTFARATDRELPPDEHYGRGDRAVVRVDWHDALAYCNYFGWRLPTETEWEYAARAGGRATLFAGTNNPDSLSNYAITEQDDLSFSFRVGTKKPNKLSIYDMSGNVSEWIGEYYQFYQRPEEMHDLENSMVRIIRGGSFNSWVNTAKVYWRVGVLSDAKFYEVGFRCAVSQEELNKQRFLNGAFHFKPAKP
ncbi:MAG: SUMF1/EgtB/PvdO family nonheme iron enzyme [Gracilimonas sp.]|uniref:formylglycine-generating enzyme family protein n=1 Tax=Gracilimonas sp. TaxID=1974203 RepID=UPI001B0FE9EB|nr:SUMF1/EgtB/PvdO family nonheme iron enzyme [Gracilimonas sp.]MBO6584575.1 SUMF1/EgtB/PvdO family nonheme iron enzyme [Gracilimonas sp.]MBO6616154.1 SUMF1/EgtB/PvdO family nonheme iron enzyme [Gracilimonas sp.]